jgi:hypothetical protein
MGEGVMHMSRECIERSSQKQVLSGGRWEDEVSRLSSLRLQSALSALSTQPHLTWAVPFEAERDAKGPCIWKGSLASREKISKVGNRWRLG